MSLKITAFRARYGRFPRVSGDEPNHDTNVRDDLEFSPRERG